MSLNITILGCGSSAGVPRVGQGWGACDPSNPKNRRRRCSILVEKPGDARLRAEPTRLLVDTGADCREQLLRQNVNRLDAVLLTHAHADHVHGLDDLRPLVMEMRHRIPCYLDQPTWDAVGLRFDYMFVTPSYSNYPPLLTHNPLTHGVGFAVEGSAGPIEAMPFTLDHGDIDALGFRFGNAAYSPDVKRVPTQSMDFLRGLDLWIVDALRYTPHPTHLSLGETLQLIAELKPKRAVLTNMHTDLDYETLRGQLPENVVPAYDGMKLTVD